MSRGFSTPMVLPGQLAPTSSLCATSWGPERWDVFATDFYGTLWHWWYDYGSTGIPQGQGPEKLKGNLVPAGGLTAISLGTGLLDVFGVSTQGTLLHWGYNNGAGNFYDEPEDLGGPLAINGLDQSGTFNQYALPLGGPSAVSFEPGRIDVFAAGADGTLLHWLDNQPGPQVLGSPQMLAPLGGVSAVSWGPERVDVFSAGADGTLWHTWADGSGKLIPWQYETLAGKVFADTSTGSGYASSLSAVSWGPGRLDVFGIAAQDTLQHWFYDPTGTTNFPTGPESLKGKPASRITANTRQENSRLDIFAGTYDAGSNPELLHWWYSPLETDRFYGPPDAFTTFAHDGPIGLPVTTLSRVPGLLDVFSCDANGSLVWWYGA